jgi:hypothetical protein
VDRNVYRTLPPDSQPGVAAASGNEPDKPTKLLKYFPAEALALYSALEPASNAAFTGTTLTVMLWISLGLAVTFCGLYLRRFWNITHRRQIAVSIGALILYVAALGGPFATISWYNAGYALFASIAATAFMIFLPSPPAPPAGP